ncbi:MAG: shikimate dehydrogenase [Eubacteriales bacterium]|nr:shikimate dehydrogenase [Eubacteriales bacterium]
MIQLPVPADQPTMYFIGVTTGQSSIMTLFPRWAETLGLKDACMKGIDIPIHAPAETYRRVVEFIRQDPLSVGALVTTHKIDLYEAAHDMFDEIDPYARQFGELSSISKQNGQLIAHAKDPITAGLSLDTFIPADHWRRTGAEAVILGAGGSALSISAYLALEKFADNIPSRIHLTNRSAPRLASAVNILSQSRVPMSFHLCPQPELNAKIVEALPAGSLIVNATGLGKDRPGSPLPRDIVFPENAIIWELNYRGSLEFMLDAQAQCESRGLTVEDGWTYFLYGWTEVIAEVFHIELTDERFAACREIAAANRS